MRALAVGLLLLSTGCRATRVAELEHKTLELGEDIAQTRALVERMQAQIERHREANQSVPPPDRMPEGYDPESPLPKGDSSRPDVILISIDTLRADHLGAWGYARDTSPRLDALARGGTRFANAWSPAPWTLPSHTTLLSGLLPQNHGAIEDSVGIGADIPMVQEAFADSGYATGGVVATLFVSKRFGFDRGFDWFYDFDIAGAKMNNASTVDAEHVVAWATQWAQSQPQGKPIFLFVHVYDAHYAYNAPPPFNEKFDRASEVGDALYRDYPYYQKNPLPTDQMEHQIAQYDEEIAYVDDTLGRFVDDWRAQRKALVVVTADHGEEFGERGSWGHAHTLFPEQLHVPWFVNGPGVRAQVVEQRVGTEDVASTVAALAAVPFPVGDGTDRAGQVRSGGTLEGKVAAQLASTSRFQTLRYRWHEPPWDLIVDFGHAKRGMCNLQTDPECERTALAQDRPRADAMYATLTEWLGHPWEARQQGTIEVRGGVITDSQGRRQRQSLAVGVGDRFAVFPEDAKVRFQGANGQTEGPWAAVGGELPDERAALDFHGRRPAQDTSVDLTDQEQQMLEALGYIQDQ